MQQLPIRRGPAAGGHRAFDQPCHLDAAFLCDAQDQAELLTAIVTGRDDHDFGIRLAQIFEHFLQLQKRQLGVALITVTRVGIQIMPIPIPTKARLQMSLSQCGGSGNHRRRGEDGIPGLTGEHAGLARPGQARIIELEYQSGHELTRLHVPNKIVVNIGLRVENESFLEQLQLMHQEHHDD